MLTVLIGPPACGKTTWARRQDARHLATDDVRATLAGDVEDHSADDRVAEAFDALVLGALRGGESVVVENGANARRLSYLRAARAAGAGARVVAFANFDEARERAARRPTPELTDAQWRTLAGEARDALAVVDGEGWDSVERLA